MNFFPGAANIPETADTVDLNDLFGEDLPIVRKVRVSERAIRLSRAFARQIQPSICIEGGKFHARVIENPRVTIEEDLALDPESLARFILSESQQKVLDWQSSEVARIALAANQPKDRVWLAIKNMLSGGSSVARTIEEIEARCQNQALAAEATFAKLQKEQEALAALATQLEKAIASLNTLAKQNAGFDSTALAALTEIQKLAASVKPVTGADLSTLTCPTLQPLFESLRTSWVEWEQQNAGIVAHFEPIRKAWEQTAKLVESNPQVDAIVELLEKCLADRDGRPFLKLPDEFQSSAFWNSQENLLGFEIIQHINYLRVGKQPEPHLLMLWQKSENFDQELREAVPVTAQVQERPAIAPSAQAEQAEAPGSESESAITVTVASETSEMQDFTETQTEKRGEPKAVSAQSKPKNKGSK